MLGERAIRYLCRLPCGGESVGDECINRRIHGLNALNMGFDQRRRRDLTVAEALAHVHH